jgi:hypothetical protein
MKKLMILALAAMPFLASAQDKPATTAAAKPQESKFAVANPETIFLELVIENNAMGGSLIRVDFGRDLLASIQDKELAKQLSELRTANFTNVPDAMNYLASIGFKYSSTYPTFDKDNKTQTHLVFEKRLPRKPNGEGQPKPNRPEVKPADIKPGATDQKPAPKPADKKGK